MKVKITPTGESAQVMEFNVSLPGGANASIAPVSTLTVTQRWAKVVNVSTTGTEYVQVTKFDVIHNIQYTDCKGNVRVATDNLLATIRKSKEHIHAQLKAKEDKVNTLLELVEQDPEIKKRLDEVMLSKSK